MHYFDCGRSTGEYNSGRRKIVPYDVINLYSTHERQGKGLTAPSWWPLCTEAFVY